MLDGLRSSVAAAESHGCLCGALCATPHYSLERWLEEIVPEEATSDLGSENRPLKLLFDDTANALRGDEMEFEPLLPDDDAALQERALALSQWCEGFLYGFGTGAPIKAEDMPANIDEVLRDLTYIGRASVELDEGNEEEEQAYSEVIEYVRVGVQLIHDELCAARGRHPPSSSGSSD